MFVWDFVDMDLCLFVNPEFYGRISVYMGAFFPSCTPSYFIFSVLL
jgi:hypothetical protein